MPVAALLCREQQAMLRCGFAAGTEVQGSLVGPGRLQGQGEISCSEFRGIQYLSVTPTPTPASVTDTALNNGSALAPVSGLASSRTFSSGLYAENIRGPSCFLFV